MVKCRFGSSLSSKLGRRASVLTMILAVGAAVLLGIDPVNSQPNNFIETDPFSDTTIRLAAADDEDEPPPYLAKVVADNGVTSMSGLTSSLCNSALWDGTRNGINDNDTVALVDGRNGHRYTIRKLADGKCWMVENLKLENYGSLPEKTNSKSDGSYTSPRVYGPVPGDTGSGRTNYGYLYNWPAATSACPSGWRLPGGHDVDKSANEFSLLSAKMAGFNLGNSNYLNKYWTYQQNWLYSEPFNGVLAGRWWQTTDPKIKTGFRYQATDAYFWTTKSSTDEDYDHPSARSLYFNSGGVFPNYDNYTNSGLSVRCVVGS